MNYKRIWTIRNRSERKLTNTELEFTYKDLETKFKDTNSKRIIKIDRYNKGSIDNFTNDINIEQISLKQSGWICRKCKKYKYKDMYIKNKNSIRGYGYVCKDCR